MPKNHEDTKGLAKDIDDVIIYGMYPMTGMRFLKWKYGIEPVPQGSHRPRPSKIARVRPS